MKFQLGVLLLIGCHILESTAQLTVDVLKFERFEDRQNLDDSSVIDSYSFPTGFSNPLDWFTEPYTNIPADGSFVGILYYPLPHNACTPILEHKQRDCAIVCNTSSALMSNLSKLALVDGYHVCTRKKLEHVQQAGFDGTITFSGDDANQNVNNRVYDSTAKSYIDVPSLQFPVAVVSKKFAQTLIQNATAECTSSSDCQQWQSTVIVVRVKGDSTRQGWIQIAIGIALVVVIVGVPLITCIVVCLCCVCCCANCRGKGGCGCGEGGCVDSCRDCCEKCNKSGVYEVHELQHRVLGPVEDDTLPLRRSRPPRRQSSLRREEHLREREESLHNLRRTESESNAQFRRTYETRNSTLEEREFVEKEKETDCKACAICLSEFKAGDKVCVLPCDDGHIFHTGCIEQWLQTNSVCPVCRTFFSVPNH